MPIIEKLNDFINYNLFIFYFYLFFIYSFLNVYDSPVLF